MYAGVWILTWTGWKSSPFSINLYGQWVAFSRGGAPNFYSAYPGTVEKFRFGDEFNCGPRYEDEDRQEFPTIRDSLEQLEEYKQEALERLKVVLDNYLGKS